jgi:hypothetical protein
MREGRIVATDSPAGLKKALFPTTVLEFNPKVPLSFAEISALETHEVFSFFEPYGLRFHAAIESQELWERERAQFEQKFHIRTIQPTLEDVFIRAVEGAK